MGHLRLPAHWKKLLALLVVVIVLIAGGCLWQQHRHRKQPVKQTAAAKVITNTTSTPSESKAAADSYVWSGAPTDPKQIIIPAIHVQTYLQKMGVDQNHQVAAPTNIFLAGWYVNSVKPGQRGLSIIDGHVDGRNIGAGVFYNLAKLKAGDSFSVVLGSGKTLHYSVTSSQSVPDAQVASVLFSQDPTVTSQLNLITCGGVFDRTTRHYENRIVITAALQSAPAM